MLHYMDLIICQRITTFFFKRDQLYGLQTLYFESNVVL